MAKLSTSARKALPGHDFAGPDRTFPVENKTHADKALQLAPYAREKGDISAWEEHHIETRARNVLGEAAGHLQRMHSRK